MMMVFSPCLVVPVVPSAHLGCTVTAARPAARMSSGAVRGLEALPLESQAALLEAMGDQRFAITELAKADGATWAKVREAYPGVGDVSDAELDAAIKSYIDAPPTLADALFKTPVGPVLLVNLLAWALGVQWCDLPFADPTSQACVEVAARGGGGGGGEP